MPDIINLVQHIIIAREYPNTYTYMNFKMCRLFSCSVFFFFTFIAFYMTVFNGIILTFQQVTDNV